MQRKLALVIGNGNYDNKALRNTVNDANDMASRLESIGFQVTKGLHLKTEEMDSYVNEFVRKIQPSDLVLFYFSGHGTQWEDQNYLMPCDNGNITTLNIKRRALNAQHVLDQITQRSSYASIIILDCCRNYGVFENQALVRGSDSNPKGLREMTAAAGSLLAFACAAGTTSSDGTERNGLYTKHLLKWIVKPNEQVQDMFISVNNDVKNDPSNIENQRAWSQNGLTDRDVMLYRTGGTDTPWKPNEEEEEEEDVVQPNPSQTLHSNPMQNWPPTNDDEIVQSVDFTSSGFDSNGGQWHQEFHNNSFGNNMNSFIKEQEEQCGFDLNFDGQIG